MIKKSLMRKPSDVSWGNIFAGMVAGAAGLLIGYLFFIQPAQQERDLAENKVAKLKGTLEDSKKPKASSESVTLPNPSEAEITNAIESAANQSGMVVQDIDFVGLRAEVFTESEPLLVSRFTEVIAKQTKTKPSIKTQGAGVFPISATGETLPRSVIVIETLRNLAG